MMEHLTERQAELAQANNFIQLLEHRTSEAAEEIEVSYASFALCFSASCMS